MQIYAVEIAAKEDRGFVSSFTLMTGNVFGLAASCIICERLFLSRGLRDATLVEWEGYSDDARTELMHQTGYRTRPVMLAGVPLWA